MEFPTHLPETQSNNNQQQGTVIIHNDVPIELNIQPVRTTYYCVTSDQLKIYTDMSHLTSLFSTLFSLAIGAAIGLWGALNQNGLTSESVATLTTAMWALTVFGLIFLACAALCFYRHRKQQSSWISFR